MQSAEENVDANLNLNSQTIVVSYEKYAPFCIVKEDGSLSGIFPTAMDLIAQQVNLTILYVPFTERSVWSRKESNGTWSGALADIYRGLHVSSVAGFVHTLERFEIGRYGLSTV